MSDEEAILKFLRIGFTKYEARVYYALLKHGALTSTELIKIAGIPQARLYDIIEKLVSKGLVKVSKGRPTRYSLIEPGIALKNYVEQEMLGKIKIVDEILKSVEKSPHVVEEDYVWSVSGIHGITALIRDFIEKTEDELLITTYTDFAEKVLLKNLEKIEKKEVSVCVILYDKNEKIIESLVLYDEVRLKPTQGPIMILRDLSNGLIIPRTYKQRPIAYVIEDAEILSPIINYFFSLRETSSPIVYRLGVDISRRRFRNLLRAIEMIQKMQENGMEVEVEVEGRWLSSGEVGVIKGKPISATRDKYREITSLIIERDGARILVGGRGAIYEDFEAFKITVYRPPQPGHG
ncbi:MAG: TrmB family transcriptional regulator [Zestosphaera sp.]